ncbi:16884_t:CDS:1, partial [Dentiscutata heterogama]
MNNSQGSFSTNTFRTKRSYNNRQCGLISWIFMPVRRGTFLSFYKSHSFHNDISFKNIPTKYLNDQEIQEQLQKIYQEASDDPSASIKPRRLTQFWHDYCIWLSKCKNLEDSQSQ